MKRTELLEIAKPILFNTEMVQAILNGRKTVTRRVVKPQPKIFVDEHDIESGDVGFFYNEICRFYGKSKNGQLKAKPINKYNVGDYLYVRETFCSAYEGEAYFYFADKHTNRQQKQMLDYDDVRWKPSIHMPKEAARLLLKVTGVRVERLQDITHSEVLKEGVIECDGYCEETQCDCIIYTFSELWDGTLPSNKNKFKCPENGWRTNPWVWVYEFERVKAE